MIETLIVITNYDALDASDVYVDPQTRMRWGVEAKPVDINGKKCLPLEWGPK